jgi:type IV pilus assembly protein PilB
MLRSVQPRNLARLLVDRGLVEKFVIDQTLVKLRPKETLADRLVSDSAVTEADLLRAVAQSTGTKFISSPRLADLRLAPDVLDMIPLTAAQEWDVLPLAYNAAQKALTVVIADPEQLAKLDGLPRVGKMDLVVANVAMPAAIRSAIARLHGLDKHQPTQNIRPVGKCTQCSEPYFEDQLECAHCGLLLNANAPTDSSEARIVRALLSQPSGLHKVPSRAQVHDSPTRRGLPIMVIDEQTPELSASLEIARSLSEFEAFLISYVDGKMTVGELSEATGLQGIEVRSVIASLADRKILRLREPPPPPPAVAPATAFVLVQPSPVVAPPAPVVPPPAAVPPLAAVPGFVLIPTSAVVAPSTPPAPPPTGLKKRGQPPPPPPPVATKPAAKAEVPTRPVGVMNVPRHMNPQAQMENSIQAALALERRGEVDGAISVLRTAISRSPNPATLYNRLALVILNQRKDARQAEELIQKAIELEPENPVFKANLIKVLAYSAINRR